MTRMEILDQIEEDLKTKIIVTRGYNHTPVEVRRGLHKWTDFNDKPVVCFTVVRDEPDELSEAGSLARWIYIEFYGLAETDGLGETDVIHEVAQDVQNFLFSTDFTYTDVTEVGETLLKEGGVSDPINAFSISTRIMYEV